MPLSEEDRKALAKEIVTQIFAYIDISIGESVRKKILWLAVLVLVVLAIWIGILKVPGVFE